MEAIPFTDPERVRRDEVLGRVAECIRSGAKMLLPRFEVTAVRSEESGVAALMATPNEFGGTVGEFSYLFEDEEDLLHLIVARGTGLPLTPEEAQQVLAFLLPGHPPSLIWLKPGTRSQHFFAGHDSILDTIAFALLENR